MTDPLEPFCMDERDKEYIEWGIAQAEYANLMNTVDWVVVNQVVENSLVTMLHELHDSFGLKNITDRTVERILHRARARFRREIAG